MLPDDADAGTGEQVAREGVFRTFGTLVIIDDFHVDKELDAFVGVAERIRKIELVVAVGGDRVFEIARDVKAVHG